MKKADVAIIGAGLAGIFAAYELVTVRPDLKIILLEQGNPIASRQCPILQGKVATCINCKTCAIMRGFGGAGAFSDGKFNFTTEFGGWLTDYLEPSVVLSLINDVDAVNRQFGAVSETYSTQTPEAEVIRRRALSHDIHLLNARCKHLGTEKNRKVLEQLYEWLEERVEVFCNTYVSSIIPMKSGQPVDHLNGVIPDSYELETSGGRVACDILIAAPGRSGAEWFSDVCRGLHLPLINNQVDIGVRVELPALIFKDITDAMYEAKLKYMTRGYNDIVRTFCMNPYGYVVTENTDGIITVNGHSFDDPALASENTNFALLVSNRFTEPFKEPYRYGKHIASLSNMLGGGVMVQRLGDLKAGRRTNAHRMAKSFVRPTLEATPGDLSLVLPKRHLDNILEMLEVLDHLAPGTANTDTLLYGVEVKFYSARLELTNEFETGLRNFFAIGDGAGITRGLSQAGASGLHAARSILKRLNGNG
ncbi:MAG TPA: NAD(P)/FAD-dependent oxidoreductase [Clostridia bacterium]|nr:NAD(P)/FAD-dependent oxidoreductase [Clostridia bacterium]